MTPILGIIASSSYVLPNSFESIATINPGGTTTATFSSIPSTYKHLQIRIMSRNTNTPTSEFGNIDMRFNGDTAANYSDHVLSGDGSTVSTQANFSGRSVIGITCNPCSGNPANEYGVAIVDILDYADTNKYKTVRALRGGDFNGSGSVGITSGNWRSTSAINSITLLSYGSTTYSSYVSIALYGIKG